MATLLTKKSDTASSVPLAADLTNAAGGAELAVNTADKRLYSKTSGGTVVELGTNPSSMTLPNGTANGIPYLNGSKVLTSGSALTFDGMTLTNTSGAFQGYDNLTLTAFVNGTNGTVVNINSAGTGGITKFSINSSEQMRLTSTGLGIGTSSPAYKLDVSATGTSIGARIQTNQSGAYLSFLDNGGVNGYVRVGSVNNDLVFLSGNNVNATLNSSGNLGLGVTPSASTLPCFQSDYGLLIGNIDTNITNNAYYNGGWKYVGTGRASMLQQDSGGFYWYSTGTTSGTAGNAISFTQAMTLDASGNLLVGQTGLGLQNSNSAALASTAGNQFVLNKVSGSGSGNAYVVFGYAGTGIGSITQNGTTAVAYNTTSDHRLKNNVRTADALRFKDIRFVDFEWVDGRHDCGVIAHELQAIYPDLVVGTKDETEVRTVEITPAVPAMLDEEGNVVTPEVPAVTEEQTFDKHQQVNYIGLIPRMGTVVQQLMAEVEAMKAEIAALKAAP